MSQFKKWLSLCMAICMLIGHVQYVHAAVYGAKSRDKLEETIASKPRDAYVDVMIKLKREVDVNQIKRSIEMSKGSHSKDALKQATRKEIVEALEDTAERSQLPIIDILKKHKETGEVKTYESFSIVNCIHVIAKKSLIHTLANRSDIESITENKTLKADKPVANEPNHELAKKTRRKKRSTYTPWNLEAISAIDAQNAIEVPSKEVVVAIIDSGVDGTHPALKNNYRGNDKAIAAYSWYNTITNKDGAQEQPTDARGHGTHVCGTILGTKEDANLGVAPKAKWMAVKVFDDHGETDNAKLLKAGEWIMAPEDSSGKKRPDLAPDVVNNSWGGNSTDGFYRDIVKAWRAAGIFPVFSAGNVSEFNSGGEGSISTPGSYPEAYAVGAIRKDNIVAKFSLRGKSDYTDKWKPDIVAPGVNILSSLPGGRYDIETGTSMASPHVTGVVALVLQANKDLSVDQIEKILNETATPLKDNDYTSAPNHGYGHGKINAYAAVEMAKKQVKGTDIKTDGFAIMTGRLLARGEDKDAPILEHTPMSSVFTTYKTTFEANVKDNTGIRSVQLYLDTGEGFKEIKMNLLKGNATDGYWRANVDVGVFKDKTSAKYYIEAQDINGLKTKTAEQTVEIKSGVGIGYTQDFSKDLSGFEFGGETALWHWGEVKGDVPKTVAGNKMIMTGPYENIKGNAVVVMPPIDLSNEKKNAALSFKHWYDLGNSNFAFFDTAEVWIAVVDENSSAENLDWKLARSYKNSSKDHWRDEYIDLSQYKGKKIALMFGLRANAEFKSKGKGWYIDDIKITEASKETPQKPNKSVNLRGKKDGKLTYTFSPVADEKISAYALYRGTDKNGPFECVKTIQKGDEKNGFGKYSIDLTDTPKPQKGTYYYYAVAKIGDNESEPSEILSHTFTTGKEFKSFNFENGEDGWTTSETNWEFGVLVYGDQFDTNYKKPIEQQSLGKNDGMHLWATNMNDYRTPGKKYTLISPTMDLSMLKDAKLFYQNWFGSSGKRYSDDYGSYHQDIGEVYVSKDDGSNWTKIFTLNEQELDKSGIKHAWFTQGVDIPAEYLTTQFKLKFVLDAGNDASKTDPQECGGWYIDDVSINTETKENTIVPTYATKPFKLVNMSSARLASIPSTGTSVIPLVGKVTVKETGQSVMSEPGTGAFSIKHKAGSYTLIAESEGYAPKEVSVEIKADATEDIYLDPATKQNLSFDIKDEAKKAVSATVVLYKQGEIVPLAEKVGSEITFNDLLPGTYDYVVRAEGYLSQGNSAVVGEENQVHIQLKAQATANEAKVGYTQSAATELAGQDMKGRAFANRIVNDKPLSIKEISYYISKTKNVDISGSKYVISIYDKNGKDGLPGKVLFKKELTANTEGWQTLNVGDIQVDGDFFIAYEKISGDMALGIDNKANGDSSYQMFNGAWNEPATKGMYMLGAKVAEISEKKTPEYTISFNAGEGSGTMATVSVKENSKYKLPAPTFIAPVGKEFAGWDVNGATKAVGEEIAVTGNMEVKALWKDIPVLQYTISFNAGEGSGTMATVSVKENSKYKLPAPTFVAPAGKEFAGWDVNGATKAVGEEIAVTGNMEVKALWKDKQSPVPKPTPKPGNKGKSEYLEANSGWMSVTKVENQSNTDVPSKKASKDYDNHWAEKAIDFGFEKNYFKDIAEKTNFMPEQATTRGEFVTILARAAGFDVNKGKAVFKDVDANKYYADYISWAYENKIVNGVGDGRFAPDKPMTRAEMATMMERLLKIKDLDLRDTQALVKFVDQKSIPHWAAHAVESMVKKGVLKGDKEGTFRPQGELKRAEIAQVVYNIVNK